MGSLLEESHTGHLGLSSSAKNTNVPLSRKERLQAELKLLDWHKHANNAAIKGALLQTKQTKYQMPSNPPSHTQDDAAWIQRVIKQEHIKPLEVSKDYVIEYEKREKENADRLANQVDKHISTLKTLRMKLEARHDLKARSLEYRNWQKEFLPKKHAVMIGKTIEEYENSKKSPQEDLDPDAEIDDKLMNKHTSSQELTTVLDSLSRLADLEQRIAGLEKENQYDLLKQMETPSAGNRTEFEFKKKRTAIPGSQQGAGPVGMVYEVRAKRAQANMNRINKETNRFNKNWRVQPTGKRAVGGGLTAARTRHQDSGDADDEQDLENESIDGPGIFITAQKDPAVERNREQQRRERQRQIALATAGQKNLRNRVQVKKTRLREQQLGLRKHEDAMKELSKRKAESYQRNVQRPAKKVPVTRGVSNAPRNKNRHMAEFEKIKAGHAKRKEDINRKLPNIEAPSRRTRGTKNTNVGIGERFISQTAPAYDNRNHPLYRSAMRKPATKTGGTTTRRANNIPTRRNNLKQDSLTRTDNSRNVPRNVPLTAPPIAVRGLGGLRVIKATGSAKPPVKKSFRR